MTKTEILIVANVLKIELGKSTNLLQDEENETLKSSLEQEAAALRKAIKLFEVLSE